MMNDDEYLLAQVQRIAQVSEADFFRAFEPGLAELLHSESVATTRATARRIDRLLVAVDLSECSRAALNYAIELARRCGCSSMAVVHVLTTESLRVSIKKRYPFTPRTTEGPILLDDSELIDLIAEEREKSYTTLQCFVPTAAESLNVALQVVIGDPFEGIIEAARAWRADLVVMGTHGRTGLQRVVMGSVAERVVRAAPCAVLTVKEG